MERGPVLSFAALSRKIDTTFTLLNMRAGNLKPLFIVISIRYVKWYWTCTQNKFKNGVIETGGPMLRKPMETLHTLMTNQFFIFIVAILLFLLAITLMEPGKGEAVSGGLWT
jgi:hypothetical protein